MTGRGDTWLERGARLGMAAYGLVHLLIALLAVQLALGDRSEDVSAEGALAELSRQPLGALWLWLCVAGFVLLVLWQVLDAVIGERSEEGPTWTHAAGCLAKAAIYGFLAYTAARVAGAGASGGGGGGEETLSATVMAWPAGQWLVVLGGLVVIGYGAHKVYQGLSDDHADELAAEGRSGEAGRAYLLLGAIGYVAKGIALGAVGVLFCWAGLSHDPNRSGGLDQALGKLLGAPLGPAVVLAIGLGFACYGVFCLARARHFTR